MIIKIPDLRKSSFTKIYKWLDYLNKNQGVDFNNIKDEISIIIGNFSVKILPFYINGYINSLYFLVACITIFRISAKLGLSSGIMLVCIVL